MPATIISKVIEAKKDAILEAAVLRTATFAEEFYPKATPRTLSDKAVKLQVAAHKGEINNPNSLKLAGLILGEEIPALDYTKTVDFKVGGAIVPLALPDGIDNPNKDLVGTALMCVSTKSRTRGAGFRRADGEKFYLKPVKNYYRPATEAEVLALVNGLLETRPTLTVKLFNDKVEEAE